MQPTDILMKEHRLIEQVLNCLEKIVRQATTDRKLEKGFYDTGHSQKNLSKS